MDGFYAKQDRSSETMIEEKARAGHAARISIGLCATKMASNQDA